MCKSAFALRAANSKTMAAKEGRELVEPGMTTGSWLKRVALLAPVDSHAENRKVGRLASLLAIGYLLARVIATPTKARARAPGQFVSVEPPGAARCAFSRGRRRRVILAVAGTAAPPLGEASAQTAIIGLLLLLLLVRQASLPATKRARSALRRHFLRKRAATATKSESERASSFHDHSPTS